MVYLQCEYEPERIYLRTSLDEHWLSASADLMVVKDLTCPENTHGPTAVDDCAYNKAVAKSAIKIVNLELNRPTVPLALSLLEDALRIARDQGHSAVKLIHGYGSSGVGGDIRIAVQKTLARKVDDKQIRAFVPGEDWRISNEDTWALLKRCPELKQDSDLGRSNRGITIVVL